MRINPIPISLPSAPSPSAPELALWQSETALLDYRHADIQALITQRGWINLNNFDKIGAVYNFVRDEIQFGYNTADDLPASRVLADGIGQCNTKGTLLMALLRAVGVVCRFHGFTIDKALQRGAITGLAYRLAPRNIIHSWVEVWSGEQWVQLEGFILDRKYLGALQKRFASYRGAFCGYGAATSDLQNPDVDWRGSNTYIQRDGINQDFGLFDSPDAFYSRFGVNLSGFKRWIFLNIVRDRMNANVMNIRSGR